jgi:hypothetical protein
MTLVSPPGYLQAGTYSALLDRMYDGTISTVRAFALAHGARQGFYPSRVPAFSVVGGMTVAVGPCAGVIANTFIADGGDYKFANPSNFQVVLAGSSPTLNRYDIIGVQVKDNFYDASGLNQVAPAVIQGTNSAGTPVDPSLPASFIPVCRAVVSAGATSPTLQSMIVRTTHDGGLLPIASDTERTALGTPYAGFPILRTDQYGMTQMWTGSAWVTPPNAPYFHTRQTVQQVLLSGTWTALIFDLTGEDLDNFGGHVSGGTASRYTVQRDGVYLLNGAYACGVNAVGGRACRWAVNGTAVNGSAAVSPTASGFYAGVIVARPIEVRLVAGDYVELQAHQNSGSSLGTIVTGENQSSMTALWVAP